MKVGTSTERRQKVKREKTEWLPKKIRDRKKEQGSERTVSDLAKETWKFIFSENWWKKEVQTIKSVSCLTEVEELVRKRAVIGESGEVAETCKNHFNRVEMT